MREETGDRKHKTGNIRQETGQETRDKRQTRKRRQETADKRHRTHSVGDQHRLPRLRSLDEGGVNVQGVVLKGHFAGVQQGQLRHSHGVVHLSTPHQSTLPPPLLSFSQIHTFYPSLNFHGRCE